MEWKPLEGKRVHLLGLAFRPGVKVDTFSPAYPLRDQLRDLRAVVTLEDPYYDNGELQRAGFEPGTATGADVVVLNTAHGQYANPDFTAWQRSGVGVVLDGRNFWNQADAEAAGLLYLGVGRAPSRSARR